MVNVQVSAGAFSRPKKLLWLIGVPFISLSLLTTVHAAVVATEAPVEAIQLNDTTAQSLFASSGLLELVEQIPASTASSFEGALTAEQLPDLFKVVDHESIKKTISNAFKFETFNKYLLRELENGMNVGSREAMLNWYETPLGVRVKQAELDNSLLTQQARFDEYQTYLSHYPADVKREQLILNLDYTMKSTESAVDMMTNIQIAFNLSLSRFMPEGVRLSRQEILLMIELNKDELLAQYEQQTQAVLLFTYQDLSDEDLVRLDEVLGTEAGQDFVVAINDGIKKGMFAASLDLGDGLGALLDRTPRGHGI